MKYQTEELFNLLIETVTEELEEYVEFRNELETFKNNMGFREFGVNVDEFGNTVIQDIEDVYARTDQHLKALKTNFPQDEVFINNVCGVLVLIDELTNIKQRIGLSIVDGTPMYTEINSWKLTKGLSKKGVKERISLIKKILINKTVQEKMDEYLLKSNFTPLTENEMKQMDVFVKLALENLSRKISEFELFVKNKMLDFQNSIEKTLKDIDSYALVEKYIKTKENCEEFEKTYRYL